MTMADRFSGDVNFARTEKATLQGSSTTEKVKTIWHRYRSQKSCARPWFPVIWITWRFKNFQPQEIATTL